mmetsp:Transcript_28733/g.38324  ORF Transcript_28733/g.38324 Transcript_28733/m.38324 type:complete len:219 (-) Transcript_28733:85-741(-)
MDLFGCLRVDAVEEVLETALVLVIREVYKLLELLLEAVSQESVVDARHSCHVDANDAEVLHLLGREARSHEVDAAAEPAILRSALLEPDISTCLKLSHQAMNVLLGDFVNFALKSFVDLVEVFQIFMLVVHAPLQKRSFALNLANQLLVVNLIERVPSHLLGPIGENTIELVFVVLTDILALLKLARDFEQLLDQLRLAQLKLANAHFPTNLEQLHYI